LRYHLYRKLEIARCDRILEIGCGTGVITSELAERTNATIHGLDIDPAALSFFKNRLGERRLLLTAGAAGVLPFHDESFDLIVTHYLWLWVKRPEAALGECHRVLKKGGCLAALAEPDYYKRIDEPDGHPSIKEFLSQDLKDKGADPDIGGKLEDIFSAARLKTEAGMVSDEIYLGTDRGMFQQEWELLEKLGYPPNELDALKGDTKARMTMPVCWAIGRKI
jgi:SAM-dependent methyltransferase